ncbi:hypothetical protein KKJ00_08900 [Xenorhabdus bovienii]|nr:hypothetical protein [Xenorhabdus bovienii]MDE9486189.1 hypothetical protein [Xenorhabdus bovienii]MDE9513996.1 hypothetical protein [Xenorhabdus bovienii]
MEFSKIKRDIKNYARNMNQWWKKLQHYSIAEWSLLVGIGCWGIPNQTAQMIAFLLSLMFFFDKLVSINHKSSFTKMEKRIIKKIKISNLSYHERTVLFGKLDNVRRFRSIWNSWYIFKKNWKFMAGYTFLFASFLFQLRASYFG